MRLCWFGDLLRKLEGPGRRQSERRKEEVTLRMVDTFSGDAPDDPDEVEAAVFRFRDLWPAD